MKPTKLIVTLFVLASVLLGACTPAAGPAATTAPAAAKTLKIVSSFPLTGASLTQTSTIVNSIKLKLKQINNQVCGGKYNIVFESNDDASAALGKWDGAVETENANKAVADASVVAYIGTFNSGAAALSIPILNKAGLVMISPANTYAGLTKAVPNITAPGEPDVYYPSGTRNYARTVPSDEIQGAVDVAWSKKLGVQSVYILDDAETYGKGIADAFNFYGKQAGLTIIAQESIDPKAADYKTLMTRIAASNGGKAPDEIYVGMVVDNNAAQLLKDKVSVMGDNTKVKFMGPDGINTQSFIDGAGKDVAEGVYATTGGQPLDKMPQGAQDYLKAYAAEFGATTEPYAIYGYETISVVITAFESVCKAGGDPSNRAAVLKAVMGTQNYAGVLGTWSFDKNGDTSLTSMESYVVKGGKFVDLGAQSQ